MPSTIEQLYRQHSSRGLVVLAINIQERQSAVARWAREQQVTVPVLLDEDGEVTRRYGVLATPSAFLIDREGRLVGKAVGSRAWDRPEGQRLIEMLLAMTSRR